LAAADADVGVIAGRVLRNAEVLKLVGGIGRAPKLFFAPENGRMLSIDGLFCCMGCRMEGVASFHTFASNCPLPV